jgi:hypothetical protein
VVHHLTTRRSQRRSHIVLYIFFSHLECGMAVGWEGKERKDLGLIGSLKKRSP